MFLFQYCMAWSFRQKALLENKKLNASFIYSNFKENLYHWVVLCKRLWTDNAWRTADHMKYSIRTQYYLKNTSSDILTCLRKQQRDGRFCKMSSVGIPYDVIKQEFLPLLLRQRTTQGPQIIILIGFIKILLISFHTFLSNSMTRDKQPWQYQSGPF